MMKCTCDGLIHILLFLKKISDANTIESDELSHQSQHEI